MTSGCQPSDCAIQLLLGHRAGDDMRSHSVRTPTDRLFVLSEMRAAHAVAIEAHYWGCWVDLNSLGISK